MRLAVPRRRVLALGGAAFATALLAGCGTSQAHSGLFIRDAASAPRWIADTTGAPAWSPDGERLAWGDEYGLKMWSSTSGDISQLTEGPIAGRPTWSPDGGSIAFLDSTARELVRIDLKSHEVVSLARLFEGVDGVIRPPMVTRGGPAWSPDGTRIAFICWDGFGDELCVVSGDGASREQVTTLGIAEQQSGVRARSSVSGMAWSPESSAITVSVHPEQQGAAGGIYRIDLSQRSGVRISRLTANAPIAWAPGTDDVIFSARVEGRSDVYRISADGGNPEALTTVLPDGAREPAIDMNGVLAVVSGRSIAILRPGSRDVTSVEIAGLSCAAPALSANGERLAFLALPQPIERYP